MRFSRRLGVAGLTYTEYDMGLSRNICTHKVYIYLCQEQHHLSMSFTFLFLYTLEADHPADNRHED